MAKKKTYKAARYFKIGDKEWHKGDAFDPEAEGIPEKRVRLMEAARKIEAA